MITTAAVSSVLEQLSLTGESGFEKDASIGGNVLSLKASPIQIDLRIFRCKSKLLSMFAFDFRIT